VKAYNKHPMLFTLGRKWANGFIEM
jgi:hypothetical protein